MPAFMTAPPGITPRRGLTGGLPGYCSGSYAFGQSPTRMNVTSVAIAANVVTLGGVIQEGNIPTVGSLVTVRATSVGTAAVNVTNIAITASTFVAATGVGTITYPATAANLTTTPDVGIAYVAVPEVGETNAIAKLQQFALAPDGGYGVTMVWSTPSAPATIALQLEGAINDTDAEYSIIGSSQTTLSGTLIATAPVLVRFVRINVTGLTGGPGTLIAKLYQSTNSGN